MRIGINVEDVIVDGASCTATAVNIAARHPAARQPGRNRVTAAVREYVWTACLALSDLGERSLKKHQRPVRIYRVEMAARGAAAPLRAAAPNWTTGRPSR